MARRKLLSVKKARISTLKEMSCRQLVRRLSNIKVIIRRLDTPSTRRKLPSRDRRRRKGIASSEASKTIKMLNFKKCSTR